GGETENGSASPAAPPLPAPQPVPPPAEKLIAFDYRRAEVVWLDGSWHLRAGDVVVKDFGRRESEAREVLRILRELRLTHYGTIATERAVMEYWLSEGRAPQGFEARLRGVCFEPETLHVEAVQGQSCLLAGQLLLFNFGPHPEDAQQALEVIRHYG